MKRFPLLCITKCLASALFLFSFGVPTAAAELSGNQRSDKQTLVGTAKSEKDTTEQLQAQIRITQREREEAAQEHQLLKNRLAEMEKMIQELMQKNAERDAALKAQSRAAK